MADEEDVEFLDAYADASELGPAYEDAWTDWAAGEDHDLWDGAAADGLR